MKYIRMDNLRNVLGDTRGASIISYALLLGALAVALIYGVRQVSSVLVTSLSNQASDLQAIADGSSGSSSSGGSTAGSDGSGGSGGSGGSSSSGDDGNGDGNGNGNGNGGRNGNGNGGRNGRGRR